MWPGQPGGSLPDLLHIIYVFFVPQSPRIGDYSDVVSQGLNSRELSLPLTCWLHSFYCSLPSLLGFILNLSTRIPRCLFETALANHPLSCTVAVFTPQMQVFALPFLNFMRILSAPFYSWLRSPWLAALVPASTTYPPSLVASRILIKAHPIPSVRLLMKTVKSTGLSVSPWRMPPVTIHHVVFKPLTITFLSLAVQTVFHPPCSLPCSLYLSNLFTGALWRQCQGLC